MKNLNIEKIEVKKTKVILSVSLDLDEFTEVNPAFLQLISVAVLAGGNKNCIRQISNIRMTQSAIDFDKAEELQKKFNELLLDFTELLNIKELTKTNETHKFH